MSCEKHHHKVFAETVVAGITLARSDLPIICDCQWERMAKLEAVAEAAKMVVDYPPSGEWEVTWEDQHFDDLLGSLRAALAALEGLR